MPRKTTLKTVLSFALALAVVAPPRTAHAAGTWAQAPVNPTTGGQAFGLWLLTDGTVLSHGNALNHWIILVPDKNGSYANGTWKSVAASTHARGGATQHMLKDGRFFQAGGEYIDGPACTAALCPTAEIYDPVSNTWKDVATAPYEIADTGSTNLGDGRLLYSTRIGSQIQIYDPVTNVWTKSGNMPLRTGDENAWASLQNGGVLAVGYAGDGAAIYNPATNTWKRTGPVPSGFTTGDTGGITQMFDGRVFVYGLNYHSYIYTPGATANDAGTWVEGPRMLHPEAEDEFTDVLPNGMVWGGLVDVMFGPGVALQQFDPTTNTVSAATPPPDSGNPYPIDYVNLPNGQVMVTAERRDWIYTPDTQPQDAWRPTVTSVVYNASADNYTLTGTQISGLVNGADEGDDMTMAENYPIVWLTNSTGNVYYCRSFNFSNMMPSKGSTPETTDFTTPANLPSGSYSLYVSAVGVQSKNAFPFTVGQSSTGTGGTGGTGTGGTGGTGTGGTGGTGTGGTGGTTATGGSAGSGVGGTAVGGAAGASGGSTGVAGTTGAGATGAGATGAGATGGVTGTAGNSAASGATGIGGSGGGSATSGDKSGCACAIAESNETELTWIAVAFGALAVARRRRRRSRNS